MFLARNSFRLISKENLYVVLHVARSFVDCPSACRCALFMLRRRLPRELRSVLLRDLRLRLLRDRRLHRQVWLHVRLLR